MLLQGRLDPRGNDGEPERARAPHDGDDEGCGIFRDARICDKGLIDLHPFDRVAPHVTQAGISGPDIVEREIKTVRAQFAQHGGGFRVVSQQDTFGYFQLEPTWIDVQFCRNKLVLPAETPT